MDRERTAWICARIEHAGGNVLEYLREAGCVSPWGTWFRLQLEELGRERWQITDGKGREDMRKLTLEEKKKTVEIAIEGGNPLAYLKELGVGNPSGSWILIKKNLQIADPDQYERLMEAQKAKDDPETEEKAPCTVPLNYDGFEVTGLKAEFGRFQLSNNGYLYFCANDHDELEMPVDVWRKFAEDLPRVMAILGISAKN